MRLGGCAAIVTLAGSACMAAPPGVCGDARRGLESQIADLARVSIDTAIETDDWRAAADELHSLFLALALRVKDTQASLLAEALVPAELAADMAGLSEGETGRMSPAQLDALAEFFMNHPALAGQWFSLRNPQRDNLPAAYALLDRMITELGADKVASNFSLVAAVCVVHDRPFQRNISEIRVAAGDPVDIVRYFIGNDGRLMISTRDLSPELLIYVVNVTSTPEDMAWALDKYGNDRNLGNRFFEIAYDYDHFEHGKPKKVTESGQYDLRSIKQYGGVCADQAYFAESVGKAMGVPSAYVLGVGGEVSHAWLGFLETRGRDRTWNFESGRYDAYKKVRGSISDPQTGEMIPDCYLQLVTEWSMSNRRKVSGADALVAAAEAMKGYTGSTNADPELPEAFGPALLKSPRAGDTASRLALLREAVESVPTFVPAWLGVQTLAENGEMDERMLDDWSRALDRVCGRAFPDFTYEVLESMFESVTDARRRVDLYEWAFAKFDRTRPDLAAMVRLHQGDAFEKAGDYENAWLAFDDILQHFPNDTAKTADAAMRAGTLLERKGRIDEMIPYLDRLLTRLDKPDFAQLFRSQSNFYKVAMYKAAVCTKIGDTAGAAKAIRFAQD